MNKEFQEGCRKGNHDLVEILSNRHSWDESEEVARWCRICGSVVVDLDFDGRTAPGRVMSMRRPIVLNGEG